MTSIFQRFLSAGVLIVWGVLLVYFCFSGRVASYLHPGFHAFTLAAGIVLLLLACSLVLWIPADGEEPKASAPSWRDVAGALVLLVPVLGATVISPSEFGATAVMNRGLIDTISDLPAFSPPMEPALPTEDGSVGEGTPIDAADYLQRNEKGQIKAETVDLLYAAAEPAMREDFENKEIEILGQFMPAKAANPDGDRFHLVRMFIMCCAADARPVAVMVKAPKGTSFPEMTWLKITGKATFPFEGGKRSALVVADSITEVEAPAESFTY
jgi:uncharacterized repeat protein (TIGR03943 family)